MQVLTVATARQKETELLPTATRQRLAELHAIFHRQFGRLDFPHAAKTLLEIDRAARAAGIKSDSEIQTVDGTIRASLWRYMVQLRERNNQPNEAFEIARLWGKDRGAA